MNDATKATADAALAMFQKAIRDGVQEMMESTAHPMMRVITAEISLHFCAHVARAAGQTEDQFLDTAREAFRMMAATQ